MTAAVIDLAVEAARRGRPLRGPDPAEIPGLCWWVYAPEIRRTGRVVTMDVHGRHALVAFPDRREWLERAQLLRIPFHLIHAGPDATEMWLARRDLGDAS